MSDIKTLAIEKLKDLNPEYPELIEDIVVANKKIYLSLKTDKSKVDKFIKIKLQIEKELAAIDGICMGGGLEVALACDLRIATPKSKFSTPEGKLGIIPGGGATARLPRIVGRGWGMEMLLMGESISAKKALRIGLITRLVESEFLLDEVIRIAKHLSSFAPFVPPTMKAMVHKGMDSSLSGALMLEKYAQGALVQTQDKYEGISSFLEKRTPKFKGK